MFTLPYVHLKGIYGSIERYIIFIFTRFNIETLFYIETYKKYFFKYFWFPLLLTFFTSWNFRSFILFVYLIKKNKFYYKQGFKKIILSILDKIIVIGYIS